MHNTKTLIALLAALLLGLVSQNVRAQADNNLARIYYVDVKAGHGAEFEAALQKHAQWRKQQGDPWAWMVFQVVNGENLGDFYIRSGDHAWKDFDDYAEFSAKGGADFNTNVTPHIESISSLMTAVDMENSNWPQDDRPLNLFSVTTFHLKPGQGPVFNQAVSKAMGVIKEHNRPGYVGFERVVNGLNSDAVFLVEPYENWAAMQGPEEDLGAFLIRILGQEDAMKLFQQFDSTYDELESQVLMLRPELSVLPGM